MKICVPVISVFVVAAALAVPQGSKAQCGPSSVSGAYALKLVGASVPSGGYCLDSITFNSFSAVHDNITGFVGSPNTPSTFADVGLLVSNGAGKLLVTQSSSVDGQITRFYTFTGSYTVNANCTGSLTLFTGTIGIPINYDFVIVAGGTQLLLVGTDQGLSVTGTAVHQ